MYLQFFGLTQEPFSIAPDPHYLYMSKRHREALAHLLYGVEGGGGFVVLTGEIGAGKTTVCRCLLEQIPPHCQVAYIFNPKLSVLEMMQSVCDELGVNYERPATPTVKTYLDPLNQHLMQGHAQGKHIILIIDEAQNLSSEVLEQLRLLTNLETDQRKLLQIILIGQPELRELLARPELEQLEQRVIARFHLRALSADDTLHYIRHRLGVAGMRREQPFSANAIQAIHELARGIPRRINLLCDRAMLGAYAKGRRRIDQSMVDQAAAEVFGRPPVRRPPANARWARPKLSGLMTFLQRNRPLAAVALVLGAAAVSYSLSRPSSPKPTAVGMPSSPAASQALAPRSNAVKPATPGGGTPTSKMPAAVAEAPAMLHSPSDLMDWALAKEEGVWALQARAWKLRLDSSGAPVCQQAQAVRLSCYRTLANLPWIKNLNRPVWLTLRQSTPNAERTGYLLLVGLDDRTALLQRSPTEQRRVSLAHLGSVWRGEAGMLWRMPPAYTAPLALGQRGPTVDAMVSALARWQGRPEPSAGVLFDRDIQAQLMSFQVAHGLKPDGIAGAPTFMQLHQAIGLAEPLLNSPTP
jgi:general secretion pathway protein A